MKKNLMIAMILVSAVLVASLFFIPKLNAGESNCGDYDVTCPGAGSCDCDYGTEGDVYVGEVAPGVYVCKPACGLGASCVQGQCVTQNTLSIRERTGFAAVGDSGIQVAVQKVDSATGTISAVVKDQSGRLETVTVAADGRATLRSGEILQVGAIERRKPFSRGAIVNMEVVTPGEGVGASVGGVAGVVTGDHTHLSDSEQSEVNFNINSQNYADALSKGGNPVGLTYSTSYPDSLAQLSISAGTTKYKSLYVIVRCQSGKIALGGGYKLEGGALHSVEDKPTYTIREASPFLDSTSQGYRLIINELYTDLDEDVSDDLGVQGGKVFVTCASSEPTLHQFSLDY